MTDDESPRWPAPWVRAALGTAVLAAVEHGPLHGYGIAVALAQRGLGRPKGGSLYPLLSALEADGSLAATWEEGAGGPGRRTYTLTDHGRRRLVQERHGWQDLAAVLSSGDEEGERDADT